MKQKTGSTKPTMKLKAGFTIVELLIVLAVASAIIAIVFTAVPSVQRSNRDSTRRGLAQRIASELITFSSNNLGSYPFSGIGSNNTDCSTQADDGSHKTCGYWYSKYINGKVNINDPRSQLPVKIYMTNSIPPSNLSGTAGDSYIVAGAYCNGTALAGSSGDANSKDFAIYMRLEPNNSWYCTDSR